MSMIKGFSQSELWLAVRQERQALIIEKRNLTSRIRAVNERLGELDVAEGLLDGEF